MWKKRILSACFFLLLFAGPSQAREGLTVAVAANFAPAMEEISRQFTRATEIPVQLTVSSSGRLYAQIRAGAPFDLYFSADQKRPELLFTEGYCDQPEEYARGQVVLWGRNAELCRKIENWQGAVRGGGMKKIAIPNPELAPYGATAKDVLVREKLWYGVQDQLVYGANVGQSFQYAATGAADAAFVALSFTYTEAGRKGCSLPIPEAALVSQDACVVRASEKRAAAATFLVFMKSDQARAILEQFGYRKA